MGGKIRYVGVTCLPSGIVNSCKFKKTQTKEYLGGEGEGGLLIYYLSKF